MSCLFEDGSGHGTAIAEILASDPNAAYDEDSGSGNEDFGTYTYYSEPDDEEDDDDEETIDAGKAGKVSWETCWTAGMNGQRV